MRYKVAEFAANLLHAYLLSRPASRKPCHRERVDEFIVATRETRMASLDFETELAIERDGSLVVTKDGQLDWRKRTNMSALAIIAVSIKVPTPQP